MIVPMKKLSLLLYHKEKETFLKSLQDLGVVHVVVNPEATSNTLQQKQDLIKAADRVARALKQRVSSIKEPVKPSQELSADEIIKKYEELESLREDAETRIQAANKNRATLEPWGDFNPGSVKKIADTGLSIRFFECNEKKLDDIKKSGLAIEVVNRQGSTVYFVVVGSEDSIELDADEVVLPEISYNDAEKQVADCLKEKADVNASLDKLTASIAVLTKYMAEQKCGRDLESARISMDETVDGKVLSLTGWVPEKKEKSVSDFLDKYPAWFVFEKPGVDDDIPILLTNSKFAALFEPISKMRSLPEYFELDPTPFFAPFFAVFFGLCFADVGYGTVLAILGFIASKKIPVKFKPFTTLVIILGVFTILCGFLLNTFFGHPIFVVPGSENGYFNSGAFLAPLSAITTEKGTYFPAIPLSLYVGILQIMIGMGMQAWNRTRVGTFQSALHPVGSIIMTIGITIFLVKINFMELKTFALWAFPLGQLIASLPANIEWIISGAGLFLLMFFNNPDKGIGVRLPLGLWELYGFTTALMGDGLSYLRLFALGLAGGLLGAAFNQIGFMMITKDGVAQYGSPMIVFTILILVAGHGINFVLSLIGCFVHPLRLTFVEFYKNIDFKGGAQEYSPLTHTQ